MHVYSCGQWVLLFFFYCFCGWVWESCYVSAKQRQWVNRGFLQGPLLPIYGSGAILILFATLPVAENLFLIWLLGMLAATALEYLTGAVMARLFKVRYWDYSSQKFNLKGHICLTSSIAWGFFSILLVRILHPPAGRLLARLPAAAAEPLALVLTALFTVDVVRSVQAALDLRDVLARLTEENEDLRRLARRAEVAAAFAEDDLRAFRARTELDKLLLQERIEEEREEHRQAKAERRQRRQTWLEDSLHHRAAARLELLHTISETVEARLAEWDGALDASLAERRADLRELLEKIREQEHRIRSRTAKTYQSALRILHGNPSARAKEELQEALESLRRLARRK